MSRSADLENLLSRAYDLLLDCNMIIFANASRNETFAEKMKDILEELEEMVDE